MLIALGLLTCDFVEEIWMNFVKMRLGNFGRDFESMEIESMQNYRCFCHLHQNCNGS